MLSRISTHGLCRTALKLGMTNVKAVTNRSMHSAGIRKSANTTMKFIFSPDKRSNILRLSFVRHASDGGGEEYAPSILENIPDIPAFEVPMPVEAPILYHANGEVMFSSIGLGGYTPVGIVQYALEWLHAGCGLPWWAAVATGTLVVRLLVLPILVDSLKSNARMQHYFPEIQKFQSKITQARQLGDKYEAMTQMYAMQEYMKKNSISLVRTFVPLFVQAPIFISFFFALKQMAQLPVESLHDGGLWWFKDLTIADPYYILPVTATVTMAWAIHIGAEGAPMTQEGFTKIALRVMPFFILPFTLKFQSIIFCYWVSSNFISLLQAQALKTPLVRKKLNLPVKPLVTSKPVEKKGFLNEISEAWKHAKVMKQINERDRANAKIFENAATQTLLKTYKYDPTKRKPQAQILTKKRDI